MFRQIGKNKYQIKLTNNEIKNVDIYNKNHVKKLMQTIFNKYINGKNIKGTLIFNIYINKYYGTIIDIESIKEKKEDQERYIKLIFHIDAIILYKIDYFDIKQDIGDIYYHNKNTYLEVKKRIRKKNKNILLEQSEIIYGNDALEVLNYGVKLNTKNSSKK